MFLRVTGEGGLNIFAILYVNVYDNLVEKGYRNMFVQYRNILILCTIAVLLWQGCSRDKEAKTEPIVRIIRLHYENASGEQGVTTFDYNDDGILATAVWELLDGSRFSLNQYTYDESGRLKSKERVFSDSMTSSERYEYDADGNLITELFERSDGVQGEIRYIYYTENRLIRADCDKYKGWFSGRLEFRLDSLDRKILAEIYKDTALIGYITYAYDSLGNFVQEHWDFNGEWSQTFEYEYETIKTGQPIRYSSSNPFTSINPEYRVVGETYDFSGKNSGPSYYTYSPRGKVTMKKFVRSDGLSTETTFLYDARGNLTRSYRQYADGLSGLFRYTFNDDGKLAARDFYRSDGVTGTERYSYDETGQLKSADWDNFDNWLNGTLMFVYDDAGQLISGYFEGKDDFDATIKFDTDSAGNVTKIRWDFTFDGNQTYEFQYEKTAL